GPIQLEAVLVAAPRILGNGAVLEVSTLVERIVLEELEERCVRRIRAALGHHVDVHAEIRAVLRRGASGLNLNLLDRVGNRPISGPSSSKPYWLRRRGFLGTARFSKYPRWSSASSWKNSKSDACGVFVPLLVTTLMCTPRYEPYSAEVLPV